MVRPGTLRGMVSFHIRRFVKRLLRISLLEESINTLAARCATGSESLRQRLETDILSLHQRIDLLEESLHGSDVKIPELERAYGYFHRIDEEGGTLIIMGWMFLPHREFNSFELYIDQSKVAESTVLEIDYTRTAYPHIAHARYSGFSFTTHKPPSAAGVMIDICVVGISRGKKVAKIETWHRTGIYSDFSLPPAPLMLRETNTDNRFVFLNTGLRAYRDFWTAACTYADPRLITNMLDWGCGCGRVIAFFRAYSGIPGLSGCDIDPEAVDWCRANLAPAQFAVIPPYPPTPYHDNQFDLITSCSVLTHLSRDAQSLWLKEMQRVLVPGGLLLVSVHGEFCARIAYPGRNAIELLKNGIYDARQDHSLDGVAPDGYYRGTWQTKDFTMREYSRYFDVLEYIERGMINFQDLVVMRKRTINAH